MFPRLSLAGQFLLASLAVLIAGMLIIGTWVGRQIESGVLSRTASITALYVESFVEPFLQPLVDRSRLDESDMAALDQLLGGTRLGERIVAFKVWSVDGEVLYSPNRSLIGRRFAVEGGLADAVKGAVAVDLSNLDTPENEDERQRWGRLMEVYAPMRVRGGERIIAVTEFYQLPDELDAEIGAARMRSWLVVAGSTLAMYLLLAGIVRRGSNTITRQQGALRHQVAELSELLRQNARLHERVRQAAGRTTALNEQALRRIGADLHDGPGQALALALLRLDALREQVAVTDGATGDFAVVDGAVNDALSEVRAIAAGLRLPELAPLTIREVSERAVRDHERRTSVTVETCLENLPAHAPLPVKIALFRSLQEALSNATRHGGGAAVTARVRADADRLCLNVTDRGPGFAPEQIGSDGHLGLAGIRERAEVLGGRFTVTSAPGQGTTVEVRWPLATVETNE